MLVLHKIVGGFLGIAALAAPLIFGISEAGAAPSCDTPYPTYGCTNGPWNGQQMPTWDLPGVYGGRTSNPVMCDPVSMECRQWVR